MTALLPFFSSWRTCCCSFGWQHNHRRLRMGCAQSQPGMHATSLRDKPALLPFF